MLVVQNQTVRHAARHQTNVTSVRVDIIQMELDVHYVQTNTAQLAIRSMESVRSVLLDTFWSEQNVLIAIHKSVIVNNVHHNLSAQNVQVNTIH